MSNKVLKTRTGLRDQSREMFTEIMQEIKASSSPAKQEKVQKHTGASVTAGQKTLHNKIEIVEKAHAYTDKKKRESDIVNLDENISHYIESIILLREKYAQKLYYLLVFEVAVMFGFVTLYGFRIINLEPWLVTIVAETILVKTFLTVQIIVKNLFPSKNLIEFLVKNKQS